MEENTTNKTKVTKNYKKKPALNKFMFLAIFGVLLAGISFYEGTLYQKNHDTTSNASATVSQSGPNSGTVHRFDGSSRGNFADRVFGQVSAISSTSITIQDNRSGQSATLAITSATQISNNGQSASASSIQTGDTAIATENSTNTTQATSIIVNPSFGGYGGGASGQSSPAPGTSTN